ncbi:histidinol dehydrogenase [bacterium]|nr:histidinol dehydrogenase [bacterium]
MKILRSWEDEEVIDEILNRSPAVLINEEIEKRVREIINGVRLGGDEALLEYTLKFDGVKLGPSELRVTEEEIEEARASVDREIKDALSLAKSNIEEFHREEALKFKSWQKEDEEGIVLGQIYRPIEKVGVYVPAGTAPLFSTVLMACVPAKVAGVKQIAITTPPKRDGKVDPYTLTAAKMVGVDEIYKVGGAQAIAALAFGTATIPKVDKIVGPGNIYVTAAKRALYGYVGLDTLAGPSEVAILADEGANPSYIAADMLAQAEHGLDAGILLVTTSEMVAKEVENSLAKQTKKLGRKEFISSSISKASVILTKELDEAISFVNRYAPEHLELFVEDPLNVAKKVTNAGAIFAGPYSPTSLGDYFAGPSHVLPTFGAAKFSSPLSVADFLKSSSLISYNKSSLKKSSQAIIKMAELEGLDGHAQSVRIRMEDFHRQIQEK